MQWVRVRSSLLLAMALVLAWPGAATSSVVFLSDTRVLEYDIMIPTLSVEAGGFGRVRIGIDPLGGPHVLGDVVGCRFRINRIPLGWFVFFNPSTNAVSVPIGNDAFDVQFLECESLSAGETVVLGELIFVASTGVHDHVVELADLDPLAPSRPLVRFCDHSQLDVPSGQLIINPSVAVEGVTWSRIKGFYRP